MKIGVDYYPEYWDKSIWEKDAALMAECGVKIVRISGVAWSKLEPKNGQFEFWWLDEAMEVFSQYGMEMIICIPVESPPYWLLDAYPYITRTNKDGVLLPNGTYDRCCVNADEYKAYAVRLTEQIVRRYKDNRNIIAWQLDNNIDAYKCCCGYCKDKFRKWLMTKHENIGNINRIFGGSGEYSDINQIQLPVFCRSDWKNPAHEIEYMRFVSESAANFIRELAMAVKREAPNAKMTTNTDLSGDIPDVYKLFEFMDFVSVNNYPPTKIDSNGNVEGTNAFYLDLARGVMHKNFCVMEQRSGALPMEESVKQGMIRGYSLQALAHGADMVVHFRWRTPLSGAGSMKQGLIDASNSSTRRFEEFREFCNTASKLAVIDTTTLVSEVAILYSPESETALKILPPSENFSYIDQLKKFHAAFSRYGANVDVVSTRSDLSNYKVVVAPSLFLHDSKSSESIFRFVLNGGTLILTNRSGVRDEFNNYTMSVIPNEYRELIGADVREVDAIGEESNVITDFAGNSFRCSQWCDILKLTTAKSYAEYRGRFYASTPAVTLNRYCGGVVYYVGTVCGSEFYESIVGNIMMQTGIPRLKGLPEGVEVSTRTNGIDDFIFFFNNSGRTVSIPLPKPMHSLVDLNQKEIIGLQPFEVDIVRK